MTPAAPSRRTSRRSPRPKAPTAPGERDRTSRQAIVQTLLGLSLGAYIGAKFTHLAPKPLLKAAIVAMPTLGGIIMVLFGR